MTIFANFNFGLLGLNASLLFMGVLLLCTSLFLMLLILVQRGKGGGLTGALGGMGGQSAFGSKAGDAFTKITVITALIWITLCMLTIAAFNPPPQSATATQDRLESTGDSVSGESDTESGAENLESTTSESSEPGADVEEIVDEGFELDLEGPETTTDESPNSPDTDGEPGSSDKSDPGSTDADSESGGN